MIIENLQKALHNQCYRFKLTGHKLGIFMIMFTKEQGLFIKPVICTNGGTFLGKDNVEQFDISYRNRYGEEAVKFLHDIESICIVEKITKRKFDELNKMFIDSMQSIFKAYCKGMK